MSNNKKLIFGTILANILGLIVITAHLLTKEKFGFFKYFPEGLFCIKSIFVVYLAMLILLLIGVLLYGRD